MAPTSGVLLVSPRTMLSLAPPSPASPSVPAPASVTEPSSPLISAAASSAPRSASAPAALLAPDSGVSTPIRTSLTELVSPSGPDAVHAATDRVAATSAVRNNKRILVIYSQDSQVVTDMARPAEYNPAPAGISRER